jgi:hypothetical protein
VRKSINLVSLLASLMLSASGVSTGDQSDQPTPSNPSPPDNQQRVEPVPPGTPACEYYPHNKVVPTAACGFNDVGAPNPGNYRCGNTLVGGRCVEQCVFTGCAE